MKLIDGHDVIEHAEVNGEDREFIKMLTDYIEDAPVVEPTIDIVFCEKCRECVEKGAGVDCPSGYGYLYCRRKKSVVNETDYCSWGAGK